MTGRYRTIGATVLSGALLMTPASPRGQAAAEVFTATAAVKGAGGASASAPVTITIDRKMSAKRGRLTGRRVQDRRRGRAAEGARGDPPTGTVRIGAGSATPTRFTHRARHWRRPASDDPHRSAAGVSSAQAVPGAKPKEGYDFAVIDIEVDAKGSGSGTIAPAAKIKIESGRRSSWRITAARSSG